VFTTEYTDENNECPSVDTEYTDVNTKCPSVDTEYTDVNTVSKCRHRVSRCKH
jgi:hypothetical protein